MKNIKKGVYFVCALFLSIVIFNSCEKLPLYKDIVRTPHVLDPQQGVTAWEYLNKPRTDTLFNMMLRAIKYAGIEAEYQQPDRTYIILANQAITSLNITTGVESTTSYFGRRTLNKLPNGAGGIVGKKLQDYSKAEIKDLLLYHIVPGYHTFGNLTPNPQFFPTLRTDSAVNTMTMSINNTASYTLQFNNFPRTIKTQNARTSNLQMKDNCVIHVINTYMEQGLTP
jgi:hypothetical protein